MKIRRYTYFHKKCTSPKKNAACIKRYTLSTEDTLCLKKMHFLHEKVQKNTLKENENAEKTHLSALYYEKSAE